MGDHIVQNDAAEVVRLPRANGDGEMEWEEVPLSHLDPVVTLVSPYSELRLPLVNAQERIHPVSGRVETLVPGVSLKFERGTCQINRDLLPLVAEHPAFAGIGQKACVFLADDPRAVRGETAAPQIVTGAMGTTSKTADSANAPIRGWDNLTPAEIQAEIAKGRITDPMAALAFEFRPGNGRRRERVKVMLWKLEQGEDVEVPTGEVEADAAEDIPTDARRV